MSEHFGAFLTSIVLHGALALRFVQGVLPERHFRAAVRLALTGAACAGALLVTLVVGYVARSPTLGWTGAGWGWAPWGWAGAVTGWERIPPIPLAPLRLSPSCPCRPPRPPPLTPPPLTRTPPPSLPAPRPLPHAAGPHLCLPLCPHHRVGLGAPAAQLAVLHHRPPRSGAAGAGGHHRLLQEPDQRCGCGGQEGAAPVIAPHYCMSLLQPSPLSGLLPPPRPYPLQLGLTPPHPTPPHPTPPHPTRHPPPPPCDPHPPPPPPTPHPQARCSLSSTA
jgi:hypothetical protein